MKDLVDLFEKENIENIKNDREEIKKSVDKLLDNAYCFVAVNNNGVIVNGDKASIMASITALIGKLYKSSQLSKEDIMEAVEYGFKSKEEIGKEKDEKLEKLLKKLSEMFD